MKSDVGSELADAGLELAIAAQALVIAVAVAQRRCERAQPGAADDAAAFYAAGERVEVILAGQGKPSVPYGRDSDLSGHVLVSVAGNGSPVQAVSATEAGEMTPPQERPRAGTCLDNHGAHALDLAPRNAGPVLGLAELSLKRPESHNNAGQENILQPSGSRPAPDLNPNAGVRQAFPRGRWL